MNSKIAWSGLAALVLALAITGCGGGTSFSNPTSYSLGPAGASMVFVKGIAVPLPYGQPLIGYDISYVDATNLTPHDRHSWIKLAKDYGYEVQGLFFDVPLEVCLERHQRRGRVVPEDIMRKMAGKLKPPTFEEGFSKITVVRVKQKENVAENVVESG